MTLRAAAVVPPIVLLWEPLATTIPPCTFAMAAVPAALVPIRLPCMLVPVVTLGVVSVRKIPAPLFPEITLPAPAAVPPIVLFGPKTSTPGPALGRAAVPAALVPMRFPSTILAEDGLERTTPLNPLAE